jgi:hypothetical protein
VENDPQLLIAYMLHIYRAELQRVPMANTYHTENSITSTVKTLAMINVVTGPEFQEQ